MLVTLKEEENVVWKCRLSNCTHKWLSQDNGNNVVVAVVRGEGFDFGIFLSFPRLTKVSLVQNAWKYKCIQGWLFLPLLAITHSWAALPFLWFLEMKINCSPPSICVGRVTSWLNIWLERKEFNSLAGFLLGQTLKSPMTRVVFWGSMISFRKCAALHKGSSCDRYIVMTSRSSKETFPSWRKGSLMWL